MPHGTTTVVAEILIYPAAETGAVPLANQRLMVICRDSGQLLPEREKPRLFSKLRQRVHHRPIPGLRAGSGWISSAEHDWPFTSLSWRFWASPEVTVRSSRGAPRPDRQEMTAASAIPAAAHVHPSCSPRAGRPIPRPERTSMDAPSDASTVSVGLGECGQVLSSIRPWLRHVLVPLARMEIRGSGP